MNSSRTPQSQERRAPRRRASARLVVVLTLAAGALTLAVQAAEISDDTWQPPATIAAAAEAAVATGGLTATATVDERLRLKRCAAPLDATVSRPPRGGHAVVTVSCAGPPAWRLFVPVQATSSVPVVVLTRTVQPGEVLGAGDLRLATQLSTTLPHDYVSDITQAVGLAARRTQPAGGVLTLGALVYPQVIERGALVTLIAENAGISVKTEGVALEPGRLKQRIRVRAASGRVIEGIADGPSLVRVRL